MSCATSTCHVAMDMSTATSSMTTRSCHASTINMSTCHVSMNTSSATSSNDINHDMTHQHRAPTSSETLALLVNHRVPCWCWLVAVGSIRRKCNGQAGSGHHNTVEQTHQVSSLTLRLSKLLNSKLRNRNCPLVNRHNRSLDQIIDYAWMNNCPLSISGPSDNASEQSSKLSIFIHFDRPVAPHHWSNDDASTDELIYWRCSS